MWKSLEVSMKHSTARKYSYADCLSTYEFEQVKNVNQSSLLLDSLRNPNIAVYCFRIFNNPFMVFALRYFSYLHNVTISVRGL